jgi:glycosyltransferase involved in cell wall biosynthesis
MNMLNFSSFNIKPLVSIIVPVFNAELYLKNCLDSLIAQTLNEIEILCVNDGSTDRSLEILNDYSKKDSRIRIFNQKNAGPGMARNTALDNANGKYILFCDADDAMEPDTAYECSLIMEKNTSDLVIFNTKIIEVTRSYLDMPKDSLGEYISLVNEKNSGVLNQIGCIKLSIFPAIWRYVFRVDLINRYKLRFVHGNLHEDVAFLLSYLLIINTGYALNKVFYNYYTRQGSLVDTYCKEHLWFKRFIDLPKLLYHTFVFALKNRMPLKEVYIFYWLFFYLRGRK